MPYLNCITEPTGITTPFNNMQTLKFKGQLKFAFFTTVSQMFGSSSQLTTTAKNCFVVCTVLNDFDYCTLGSSQKMGEATGHLIDRSEKRICQLNFEFWSPHVTEERSKNWKNKYPLILLLIGEKCHL